MDIKTDGIDRNVSNTDEDIQDLEFCKIPLQEGLDLKSVLSGAKFSVDLDFMNKYATEEQDIFIEDKDYIPFPVKIDEDDSDETDTRSPFEKLATRMKDVTVDGKIKKMVLRPGKGVETPPENSFVNVFYYTYLEYNDEPCDKTYAKKQLRFRLGRDTIPGLSIAVATMRVYEKSVFLVEHEYAFGEMGHPPRIPPEATILLHIELVTFNVEPLLKDQINDEGRASIDEAEKRAHALMESAKKVFNYDLKMAIREYRRAANVLESCQLRDKADEDRQVQMLVKIYTNLAVCFTRDGRPKVACSMCNNVYAMGRHTKIEIPPKLYFHNGRAHRMLGNLHKANRLLLRAKSLLPNDSLIAEELKLLREQEPCSTITS